MILVQFFKIKKKEKSNWMKNRNDIIQNKLQQWGKNSSNSKEKSGLMKIKFEISKCPIIQRERGVYNIERIKGIHTEESCALPKRQVFRPVVSLTIDGLTTRRHPVGNGSRTVAVSTN